ncbi:MAG: O-antigen ligase family protein [Planctomycetes bacterium]|nr:O-antigen ligase family protein [Planctomycetota bacterium]
MWPLKTILFFGLFWVGCLLSVFNPIWGVVTYVMIYQTDPPSKWWGIPLSGMEIRYALVAFLAIVIGLVVGKRDHIKTVRFISSWEWCIVAMVTIGSLNLLRGEVTDEYTELVFAKFWKMLLFVIIFCHIVTTRRNFRIFLWALVVGSLSLGYDAYTAPAAEYAHGRLNEVGGPDFATTSGLAAHMSAMLPLIGVSAIIAINWRWRVLATVAGAFAANAIILCRTRGAFIGIAVGTMVALVMVPRGKKLRLRLLLGVAAIGTFALTDNYYWERIATLIDPRLVETDGATSRRLDIWKVTPRILRDHPLGIGVGRFTKVVGVYDEALYRRASHNTVILCTVEFGIPGVFLIILLTTLPLWYLYRVSKLAHRCEAPAETRYLVYGLLVSITTYFVAGLGTERLYCESYWWVHALPLCLYRVVLGEVHQNEPHLEPLSEPLSAGEISLAAPY